MRPIIEAWWKFSSPDALMFATFGWGERKGQPVPRWGKNLLRLRIRPVARKLGIPDRLVTFEVIRRTLGDGHAAAWNLERHAGHAAAREYPDDG